MFITQEIDAAQADASEMNCNANDCNFWLPTAWCAGEDNVVNQQGTGLPQ